MKKFTAAILALVFISSSMGMTVHMHYCMDKLVAANLWHSDKDGDACSKCGMEKTDKKGCCKDEHKVIKTDNYQQSIVTLIPALDAFSLALPPQNFLFETVVPSKVTQLPNSNAPPERSTVPLFISNCVYRV